MKIKLCFLFAFITLYFLCGCINTKQEVSPICKADSKPDIIYQGDIKAIIDKNCNSCHNNKNHYGGVKLEELSDVIFWAKSGELYDQIIPLGGNPPRMPKGKALSNCEVLTINKWINQGLK
jgi:mono/diheme cytochrome c family protein